MDQEVLFYIKCNKTAIGELITESFSVSLQLTKDINQPSGDTFLIRLDIPDTKHQTIDLKTQAVMNTIQYFLEVMTDQKPFLKSPLSINYEILLCSQKHIQTALHHHNSFLQEPIVESRAAICSQGLCFRSQYPFSAKSPNCSVACFQLKQ